MNRSSKKRGPEQHGFTIIQMVITIAIIGIVSTFGVLGIQTARAEFRLQNSSRLFATYIEKARADSIRRHASPVDQSSVETFGPGSSTYAVSMDFGSGSVETRNFTLESGLTFSTAAKKVSFDWRGRITSAWVFQVFSQSLSKSLPVDVSGAGDITVGEQHFPDQSIPPVVVSQVTGDVAADPTPTPASSPSPSGSPTPTPDASPSATPTPTPNGDGSGNPTPTPTPTPDPSPSATPSPGPSPSPTASPTPLVTPCVVSLSPTSVSISQSNDLYKSGSATLTLSNATGPHTISATQAGNGSALVIALSLLRIDGNGSTVVTVTSKQGAGNRGVFIVNLNTDPACGSTQQLTVSVGN